MSLLSGIKFISKNDREKKCKKDEEKAKKREKRKIESVVKDDAEEETREKQMKHVSVEDAMEHHTPVVSVEVHKSANSSAAALLKNRLKTGQAPTSTPQSATTAPIIPGRIRGGVDVDDMDAVYARNVLRLGSRYKGSDVGAAGALGGGAKTGIDEDDDIDMKMFQTQDSLAAAATASVMLKKQAERDMRLYEKAVQNCPYCAESPKFRSDAIISSAHHTQLVLQPLELAIATGHCVIISREHLPSAISAPSELQLEIERYKSSLAAMFERSEQVPIFIEAAIDVNSPKYHMAIHVVPVSAGMELDAQMFFRQAIADAEGGDIMDKKKILSLSRHQPLNRQLAPGYPYISMEWGADGDGLAHIIRETRIDRNFGLDVLCGMLDEDIMRMRRLVTDGSRAAETSKEIQRMKEEWDHYDWTIYMDGMDA